MARRKGWRAIKSRRSYTIDEFARNQGIHKNTVRRWLKCGLRCLRDQKPLLILGCDAIEFLKSLAPEKCTLAYHEFFCFTCKTARTAAFSEVEVTSVLPNQYRLRALCSICSTILHKAASSRTFEAVKASGLIVQPKATDTLMQSSYPL